MCTSNRDDRKLENTVKQSRFKHLGELHKEWTEAGVSASRVTTLRHLQENQATSETKHRQKHLTWAKRKITGLLLSGPKSSFKMKVNVAFNLEIKVLRVWRKSGEAHNPCCLKSSVKFPQSVMIWAAMSSAGVCPLLTEVHSQRSHLPENSRAHASFCWKLYGDDDFTCPHCQRYQKLVQWPWCYCAWLASKLAWPEPHR